MGFENNLQTKNSQKSMKAVLKQTPQRTKTQDEKETLTDKEIESLKSDLLMNMEDMSFVTKLIERIKFRTLNKKRVYAAFLAFEDALPKYLALELYQNLIKALKLQGEDFLKDKDTLIVLTEDHTQLKEIVETTQSWSAEKGKTFNKTNSALIEFLPRLSRKQELNASDILDIPVVQEYKCKGLCLDQKLMFQKQMNLVKKLSFAIVDNMESELKECSHETRVEAWKELIEPLFESLLPGYVTDQAVSRKNKLETLMRVSFRRMTHLKRNSSTVEIENVLGNTFDGKASKLTDVSSMFSLIFKY